MTDITLIRLCDLAEIAEGAVLKIDVDGRKPLAATLLDGTVHVFDDTCPHAEESLSKGWVEDGRVVCPVHFAEFDLGDGSVHNAPAGCGRLTLYPAVIRDGAVFMAAG
ncbi:Rieske 2Fe-2S domain-containing protein (plasmid) [Tistrella bauzanensis]|jgi:nitrite reductase/ring-hydroxylating ferredoxin subunit|uniref:Rieske (2Fe-2S) protein n=1 Tax=Tistrella TaxID=171436 RepID=UPI0031F67F75